MTSRAGACVVCGGTGWEPLPEPGPRSMASDGRVLDEPLARQQCRRCGVAVRWPTAATADLYASGYGLYAHPPTDAREAARQSLYASWIAGAAGSTPARVIDVGCGNGSLLLALRRHWPAAALHGCDASAESVAYARAAGLDVRRGGIAAFSGGHAADLVVSVNVIEHVADPVAFLREIAAALRPGGKLLLVCPDGSRPGVELLMADHVHSFAPAHLDALLRRAGLSPEGSSVAPDALGSFQMAAAVRNGTAVSAITAPASKAPRARYLERWARLDDALRPRLPAEVTCFGGGEAAALLRAYAPRTWSTVRECTWDAAKGGRFGDVTVRALSAVPRERPLLLAVRPRDQRALAARLGESFPQIVTWYDLVDDD